MPLFQVASASIDPRTYALWAISGIAKRTVSARKRNRKSVSIFGVVFIRLDDLRDGIKQERGWEQRYCLHVYDGSRCEEYS